MEQSATQPHRAFAVDVKAIRAKVRRDIESGAVTEGYRADRATVLRLLNEALATEVVCWLRYKRHAFMARGERRAGRRRIRRACRRGTGARRPSGRTHRAARRRARSSPVGLLERSHAEYVEGKDLKDMIKENLIAERIAIDSYRQMVDYVGEADPTTRRLLEDILAMEEEHADDLSDLL